MLRTRCALSCSSILPSVDFRRRIPSFTFRSALVDSDHLMMFVAVSCAPIHWFRKPWTHQDSCFVVFILATTINRRLLFIAMHPASFFICLFIGALCATHSPPVPFYYHRRACPSRVHCMCPRPSATSFFQSPPHRPTACRSTYPPRTTHLLFLHCRGFRHRVNRRPSSVCVAVILACRG